jgi:AcrR family transcriptional regulator
MNEQNLSRREQKKSLTREVLDSAARRLFLEKGFDETTVAEIAGVADVSQRTFFRYFATKETIAFSRHYQRVAHLQSLLDAQDADSAFTAVRGALLEFAAYYMAIRDELVVDWRIVISSPLLVARDVENDRQFEGAIAATLGDREGESESTRRRARVMAAAVFGAVRAVVLEWLHAGGEADLVALGREALDLIAKGLADE